MTKKPLIPGQTSGTRSHVSKRNIRLALFLSIIIIVSSSMFFWVKGEDEHQPGALKKDTVVALPGSGASTSKPETLPDDTTTKVAATNTLDTVLYNQYLDHVVNGDSSGKWPVKSGYPMAGAIFPFNRIIAFYGNLYSTRMGILGELPPAQMLKKLQEEVKKWQLADTTLKVIPALHYIATTAQLSPGKNSKYRLRMPFTHIDSILHIAKQIDALVFLDIQLGHSTLEEEIPILEKYLLMPNVHLGIDPEFSMKTGIVPGKAVGVLDAAHVNYATDYLADLVKKYNLPPKILVVHRFTQGMLTNYKKISTKPEVQIVVDMDGWGEPARKLNTYQTYVYKEPVQFTGFKLFYKNDTKSNGTMLTPAQLLKLKPQPVYIQYQ